VDEDKKLGIIRVALEVVDEVGALVGGMVELLKSLID
jgi:hypothetical protein